MYFCVSVLANEWDHVVIGACKKETIVMGLGVFIACARVCPVESHLCHLSWIHGFVASWADGVTGSLCIACARSFCSICNAFSSTVKLSMAESRVGIQFDAL